MELELMPFNVLLRTTLDLLQEKDPAHIFAEPVNLSEASPPSPNFLSSESFLNWKQSLHRPGWDWDTECKIWRFLASKASRLVHGEGLAGLGRPGPWGTK